MVAPHGLAALHERRAAALTVKPRRRVPDLRRIRLVRVTLRVLVQPPL